jgi:hypothetical protein
MSFVTLLRKAQKNEQDAMEQLLMMYQPLLMKESIVNGVLNEDLYQELCIVFVHCVRRFQI